MKTELEGEYRWDTCLQMDVNLQIHVISDGENEAF